MNLPPYPLVSCIMPTRNRRHFVAQAIAYFRRQDYPNKELIIIDDGDDTIDDLCAPDQHIYCTLLSDLSRVGTKRNLAARVARGKYIVHWDDDDWYHPERLSRQVDALEAEHTADLCGWADVVYYDLRTRAARRYSREVMDRMPTFVLGNTLCYRRDFWLSHPFRDINVQEDMYFQFDHPCPHILTLPQEDLLVGIAHADNVSPKNFAREVWKREVPIAELQRILGEDVAFYGLGAG